MRFTLFDRWGTQIGAINDVISAIHKDELNGEDSLTLTLASCNLVKGNRIVWRDKFGVWHEHIVNDLKDVHEDGRMYTVAYCENSLAELFSDYIEELRPYNVTATVALQRALSVTRWQIGTVSIQGNGSASFYHISAREALSLITENWGGELSATIAISGTHVQSRSVNVTHRGSDYGKRFEWSKDLRGITREVSTDDVCTALYGYGKGLEAYDDEGNATGGFERKLTFGEINNDLDYVADEDAKQVWGLPDGNGGKKHTFGKVEFPDCEDMGELINLTRAELQRRKQPQVSYSASVIDLADAGYEFEDVRTGDTVAIIDRELGERLSGRVLCVERDLFNESATVITLGNIVRTIHDVISDQLSTLYGLRDHSAAWDGAASISESYINGVIRVWNDTMNATGGYCYYEPGDGFITYDRPEDSNPTMAIQLKGAGFRIANSKLSNGDWNWRTFGTGDGFTADCLNVGTIRGGSNYWNLQTGDLLFEQGSIRTADNSSYWNMTTGEVHLATSATLGSKSVSGLLSDVSTIAADLEVTAEQFSVDMTALTTRVATNESDISSLVLRADSFDVSVKGIQATYGTCSTAAATQTKDVTISDFTKFIGQTVAVKFTYKNTASEPILKVQNSDGSVVASGYIYVNNSKMSDYQYWDAQGVVTFVWDGAYWRVGDGSTVSKIKVLQDSITLSVSNASLGNTASIELSVNGSTQTKSIDLTGVRNAFAGESSAITISAGVITFNSNTFVVNSDNFSVTNTGVITASAGTIGGFTIGQSALYNNLTSLSGSSAGVYVGTDGFSCSASRQEDNNTIRFSIVMAAGVIEGRYNGSVVGSISPNATGTAYDENNAITKRGMQFRGDVIDLRADILTVKGDGSADGDSIVALEDKTVYSSYLNISAYDANTSVTFRPTERRRRFINGIAVSDNSYWYSALGSSSETLCLATKAYVDALISRVSALESSMSNHTHTKSQITDLGTIPSFSLSGTTLNITA